MLKRIIVKVLFDTCVASGGVHVLSLCIVSGSHNTLIMTSFKSFYQLITYILVNGITKSFFYRLVIFSCGDSLSLVLII